MNNFLSHLFRGAAAAEADHPEDLCSTPPVPSLEENVHTRAYIPALDLEAVLLFLEGAADTIMIEKQIIEPLLGFEYVLSEREPLSLEILKGAITAASGECVDRSQRIVRRVRL
ncbi:hypothetical protein ACFPES_14310 [Paenibacillus sp. GCM10023248]|uniref:hypothetical protein n=1 Tax=unclassified Paenibacillus TaxID=185978 RepID=UPI002379D568|nr:hypothetical protein [Paenibacillus sp. MAHUQ-63]MDD9268208.1 hypothetical protein [Paenibacillus sp. MAHUQ-63]